MKQLNTSHIVLPSPKARAYGYLFGALNVANTDYVFNSTVGQRAIYDAAVDYVNRVNADLDAAMAIFIEETTEEFKRMYKLPGGGYLQQRNSQGSFGAVRATGSWNVAFPLFDFGTTLEWNNVARGYMTLQEFSNHVNTVTAQNVNTVRFEILRRLLNNTEVTHKDQVGRGDLLIEPLANGDAVVYPPVLGADSEATETHYLESGYAMSSISDTNNPFNTIAAELEEHFGAPTGGSAIAVFIDPTAVTKTRALSDFISVTDMGINPGSNKDLVGAVPQQLLRIGRVLGRLTDSGVWVVEWRYLPANYMIGIHLDAPAPLIKRVDPAATGLPRVLTLVAEDNEFPFNKSTWQHRFGLGVGNRLNGVVMEIGTGGSYSIPTGFTY